MSEEEKRQQRANLLVDLDDQKKLVASLQERSTRDREAFSNFTSSLSSSIPPIIHGQALRVAKDTLISLEILDAKQAVLNSIELTQAMKRLQELQERAKQIGSTLI